MDNSAAKSCPWAAQDVDLIRIDFATREVVFAKTKTRSET